MICMNFEGKGVGIIGKDLSKKNIVNNDFIDVAFGRRAARCLDPNFKESHEEIIEMLSEMTASYLARADRRGKPCDGRLHNAGCPRCFWHCGRQTRRLCDLQCYRRLRRRQGRKALSKLSGGKMEERDFDIIVVGSECAGAGRSRSVAFSSYSKN